MTQKSQKETAPLNEILRLLRIAQDISAKEVAEKMGVRSSYVTDVERGDRTPSLKTLDKYCCALGISAEILFKLRDEQIREKLPYRKLLIKILSLLENADKKYV